MHIEAFGATAPRNIFSTHVATENAGLSTTACVCIGDEIESFDENTLRGHGTQVIDDRLVATVCGAVDRINKLVTVRTLHRRYAAEIGDVVVGRVSEVVSKRWRINLESRQEVHLMLSAVSLPGGVQRRRTAEDELNMRSVFKEGDLLSAEVQALHHDGTIMLHTRSNKYGLLSRGQLVRVPAELVKRQRQHFHHLDNIGIDIILGCNGLIFISPHRERSEIDDGMILSEQEESRASIVNSEIAEPTAQEMEMVARTAQAVRALSQLGLTITRSSIDNVIGLSLQQQNGGGNSGYRVSEMLGEGFLTAVAQMEENTRRMAMEED